MLQRIKAAAFAEIARVRKRAIRQAVLGILALGLGLTASGFALSAGYMAMARQLGDIEAALVMAGTLAVVAIGVLLMMERGESAPPKPRSASSDAEAAAQRAGEDAAEAAGTLSGVVRAIAKEMDGPSRDAFMAGANAAPKLSPVQLVLIAATAGFFYARHVNKD